MEDKQSIHEILIKQKVEFAILNHKLLKFDYVAKDLSITRDRLVEPIIMLPKEGEKNRVACNKFPGDTNGDVEQRMFSFNGIQNLELEEYVESY